MKMKVVIHFFMSCTGDFGFKPHILTFTNCLKLYDLLYDLQRNPKPQYDVGQVLSKDWQVEATFAEAL